MHRASSTHPSLTQLAVSICIMLTSCVLTSWRVTAEEPSNNAVKNASFEIGKNDHPAGWNWSQWKNSAGHWSDEHAFVGERSAMITGFNGGWVTNCSVSSGVPYQLTLRYRVEGTPSKVVVYVRHPRDNKPLLYHSTRAITAAEKSEFVEGQFVERADQSGWVKLDAGSFVPPDGSESVQILIKLVSSDGRATAWLDDVRVTATPPELLPETAATLRRVSGGTVWTEDVNRKISPNQNPPRERTQDAIKLDLARGEYGSFQISVTPTEQWNATNWRFGSVSGPEAFDKSNLRCRRVEYVNVDDPIKPFAKGGLLPDPLTDRLPCDIDAGFTQTFWFTIRVPEDQAPGIYSGDAVLIRNPNESALETCRVPIEFKIRDFSLPKEPSIDTYARMHSSEVREAESDTENDFVKRYYESYFTHRTRCSLVGTVGGRIRGNRAIVNADRFVEQLRYVRENHGQYPFFLPALWISHEHHRMPRNATWKGRRIFANESLTKLERDFEEPFVDFLTQLVERLKREDLFDETIIRFIDEPVLEDASTVNGIRTIANLIKQVEPNIDVSLTTTAPHPDLFDVIDIWVLHTDAWNRSRHQIAAAKNSGAKINVYNNGIAYLEQEGVRIRLWPWLMKKYDVGGSYSWCGTTAWRNDMKDPWTCGKSYFEVMYYPPRDESERGPIESIRWELFRQGLQDYEYMCLAERLAKSHKEKGNHRLASIGQAAVSNALALVHRWPRVRPANDRPYCRDVTMIRDARLALADAIEQMLGSSN